VILLEVRKRRRANMDDPTIPTNADVGVGYIGETFALLHIASVAAQRARAAEPGSFSKDSVVAVVFSRWASLNRSSMSSFGEHNVF
jgi:hypothetical protein